MSRMFRIVYLVIWTAVIVGAALLFPYKSEIIRVGLALLMVLAARELFVVAMQ